MCSKGCIINWDVKFLLQLAVEMPAQSVAVACMWSMWCYHWLWHAVFGKTPDGLLYFSRVLIHCKVTFPAQCGGWDPAGIDSSCPWQGEMFQGSTSITQMASPHSWEIPGQRLPLLPRRAEGCSDFSSKGF